MYRLFLALALSCIVHSGNAQKIDFKDCGSKLSAITEVDVVPCLALPCPFKKGTNVTVTIKLTANSAITDAKTRVQGIIDGIPVNFPLPDDNACNFMKCPLAPGGEATYTNFIPVIPSYPTIEHVIVKWELLSSSGELLCFTVPVNIVD